MQAVFPGLKYKRKGAWQRARQWFGKKPTEEAELSIKGLTPGMALHLADCCHPLPGDRIVGVVEAGRGVVVHTIDCDNLENILDQDENLLDLSWQAKGEKPGIFAGRVEVVAVNEAGVLANIATVVAKHDANISNLKITARDPDFFTMLVDIEVRDVKHLTGIIAALRTLSVVSSAKRLRG